MKIPYQYHQFKKEIALIILAGHETAEIYQASNGQIDWLYGKEERPTKYTDREGYFATRRRQGKQSITYGSGSVYEPKGDEFENRLFHDLQNELLSIFTAVPVSTIYILASEYFQPRVIDAIPKVHQEKIKWVLNENLVGRHPTRALAALQRHKEAVLGQKIPLKLSTRRLLAKANQARGRLGKLKG